MMTDNDSCSDGPSEEPPAVKECPLCYDQFELVGIRAPRVLPCCGALTCVGCLADMICDDEVCCPECFVTTRAKLPGQLPEMFAQSFEIPARVIAALQTEEVEETSFSEAGESPEKKISQTDAVKDEDFDDGKESPNPSPPRETALSAFLDAVPRLSPAIEKTQVSSQEHCSRDEENFSERDSLTQVDAVELEQTRARLSERARSISSGVGSGSDAYGRINTISLSSKAALPSPENVRAVFDQGRQLPLADALLLLKAAREILVKESNVLSLDVPLLCVGDLHGQYEDLLTVLHGDGRDDTLRLARACVHAPRYLNTTNNNDNEKSSRGSILFLGDYVDRGARGCEVFLYLLALKLRYPHHIHLIRGNHESRSLTGHFGFRVECRRKYSMTAYHEICRVFEALPLAAKVTGANYGDVLCCHGGIGPHFSTIQDIQNIDRFTEPPDDGPLCDILWADPARHSNPRRAAMARRSLHQKPINQCSSGNESLGDDESDFDQGEYDSDQGLSDDEDEEDFQDFETNVARGCSVVFSQRATRKFLSNNNLVAIVRAHEVQEDGYARDFEMKKQNLPIAPVTTVFSAPNYCGKYGNDAAVLILGLDAANAVVFDAVQPVEPPHSPNGMAEISDDEGNHIEHQTESEAVRKAYEICPYMPSSFRAIVECAYDMLDERAGMVKKVAAAERRKRRKSVDDARLQEHQKLKESRRKSTNDSVTNTEITTIKSSPVKKETPCATPTEEARPTYTQQPMTQRKVFSRASSVSELRARFEKNMHQKNKQLPSAFCKQRSVSCKPPKRTTSTSGNNNKIEPSSPADPLKTNIATSWPPATSDSKKSTPPAPQSKPRIWTIPKAFKRPSTIDSSGLSELPIEPVLTGEGQKRLFGLVDKSEERSVIKNEQKVRIVSAPVTNTSAIASRARRHQSEIISNRRKLSVELMTVKSRRFSAALNGDAFNEMAPSAVRKRVQRIQRTSCPHFAAFLSNASFVDSGTRGKNTIIDAQRGRLTNEEELHEVRNALRASRKITATTFDRATFENAARAFSSTRISRHSLPGNTTHSESSTAILAARRRRASEKWTPHDNNDAADADDEAVTSRKVQFAPQIAPVINLADDIAETKSGGAVIRRTVSEASLFGSAGNTPTTSPGVGSNVKRSRTGSIDSLESKSSVEGFSDNEVYALRLIFSLFDIDNSGSIDREELAKYAEEVDECVSPRDVDCCLQAIDIDGDGCISLDDWVSFAAQLKAAWQLQEAALGKSPVSSVDHHEE